MSFLFTERNLGNKDSNKEFETPSLLFGDDSWTPCSNLDKIRLLVFFWTTEKSFLPSYMWALHHVWYLWLCFGNGLGTWYIKLIFLFMWLEFWSWYSLFRTTYCFLILFLAKGVFVFLATSRSTTIALLVRNSFLAACNMKWLRPFATRRRFQYVDRDCNKQRIL